MSDRVARWSIVMEICHADRSLLSKTYHDCFYYRMESSSVLTLGARTEILSLIRIVKKFTT